MPSKQALIVLLPHPDDEFAVFPFLSQAHLEGRPLHLRWMTDGALGGVEPRARIAESMRALASVGIGPTSARSIGVEEALPDGCLHHHVDRALVALDASLGDIAGVPQVLLPAWEGGHQDHDAVHAIGRCLSARRGWPALAFPLYQGEGLPGPMFRVMAPLSGARVAIESRPALGARLRYLLACRHYRSQWRSFLGLWPFAVIRSLLLWRPHVLLDVDPDAPMDRPHPSALLYERRTGVRWDDVRAAVERLWP